MANPISRNGYIAPLSFRDKKRLAERRQFVLGPDLQKAWQQFKLSFSDRRTRSLPPLFKFSRQGKVGFRERAHRLNLLDNIYEHFLLANKSDLLALTVVLGMEREIVAKRKTKLAERWEIFTAWLEQLSPADRDSLAVEGFDLDPAKIDAIAAGQLKLPRLEAQPLCREYFAHIRELAQACRGPIDPFLIAELASLYFADRGAEAAAKEDPNRAITAFGLAAVIAPGNSVTQTLIAAAKTIDLSIREHFVDHWLQNDPEARGVLNTRIGLYLEGKDYSRALELANRALALEHQEFLAVRARIKIEMGLPTQAIPDLVEYIDNYPLDLTAKKLLDELISAACQSSHRSPV
ncbi:MAG: hypothetical protein MUC35_00390 [Candidatus Margulisbacteria bacterium]|jgi:tetratricopeptide (TPR) repeat protein|nr:hypothetical protein [Candidatus Margulisiibacteriota bacterium]